ncbi:MAG: hypothetical protein ACYTGG_08800 [Planctomycetota bacterium]|jgi:hypothetical protein
MTMMSPCLATATGGNFLTSLTASCSELIGRLNILHHPTELLDMLSQVSLVQGGVLVVVGMLCVLNGYRWHKWVVIVLAFLGGLALGRVLSQEMGKSSIVAVSAGLLCALIATPMLKVTVALFGGITGAFIGANAWTAFNSSMPDAHWAGAVMGFIFMAMASFMLFKLVIVLFTSVGGAAMILFGAITLMLQVEAWAPTVRDHLSSNQALIPLLLLVAAVAGFVIQESRLKGESDQAEAA